MRNKFKPYIRRMRGDEKATSLLVAYRLAFYQECHKGSAYVLVQRGFPRLVLDVAGSKEELRGKILVVASGRKTFKQWCRDVGHHARGSE